MSYDDDSDLDTSSREFLESPAKARREALKRKLEKVGQKEAAQKPTADLKSLQLAMLKSQVTKPDEKAKKDQNPNKPTSFGTRTREQEIAAEKMSGDTKPTTDRMVEQGKQEDKAKEEMQKQGDVQSEGG